MEIKKIWSQTPTNPSRKRVLRTCENTDILGQRLTYHGKL